MKEITYIGKHLLKPSIALPKQGRFIAVELIPSNGKLSLISYIHVCSVVPEDLYQQYQKFFREATARWTGKLKQSKKHAFAIKGQLGSYSGLTVYKFGVPDVEEVQSYRLSSADRKATIVHATFSCDQLNGMLTSQSELTLLL